MRTHTLLIDRYLHHPHAVFVVVPGVSEFDAIPFVLALEHDDVGVTISTWSKDAPTKHMGLPAINAETQFVAAFQ